MRHQDVETDLVNIEVEEIAAKIVLERWNRITLQTDGGKLLQSRATALVKRKFVPSERTCLHLSLAPLFLVRIELAWLDPRWEKH